MIVSGTQQSDSAVHIHVSILPQTPLPSRLPQYRGMLTLKAESISASVLASLMPQGCSFSRKRKLAPAEDLGRKILKIMIILNKSLWGLLASSHSSSTPLLCGLGWPWSSRVVDADSGNLRPFDNPDGLHTGFTGTPSSCTSPSGNRLASC